MRLALLVGPLLFTLLASSTAMAQELAPHERRAVPDMDGRPERNDEVADALLWIPRIAFLPVYLLVEHVLRLPIGWFLTTAERDQWDLFNVSGRPADQFTWGIVPTIFIDFGFRAAGGAYVWFDNLGMEGHGVRLRLGFGGLDWMRFAVTDRLQIDPRTQLQGTLLGNMRPDYTFLGFGPSEPSVARTSRYGRRRIEGVVHLTHRPFRSSHIRGTLGIAANELYDTTYTDGPEETITRAVRQGWYPSLGNELPAGFGGYTITWARVDAAVDTRERGPMSDRSGVRAEVSIEVDFDVFDVDRRWVDYGGGIGGFWDIDSGRTVGVWINAQLATPFGPQPIPFTELPDFGVRGRLSGFRRGWITGPSAIAATLEYRYPVWAAIEGFVSTGVGNAFGPELRDFRFEDLRLSVMFGLRTIGDPDHAITFQIGFGTETFAQGLEPAILRVTVGTQEGF
jgi:hypothetical protein